MKYLLLLLGVAVLLFVVCWTQTTTIGVVYASVTGTLQGLLYCTNNALQQFPLNTLNTALSTWLLAVCPSTNIGFTVAYVSSNLCVRCSPPYPQVALPFCNTAAFQLAVCMQSVDPPTNATLTSTLTDTLTNLIPETSTIVTLTTTVQSSTFTIPVSTTFTSSSLTSTTTTTTTTIVDTATSDATVTIDNQSRTTVSTSVTSTSLTTTVVSTAVNTETRSRSTTVVVTDTSTSVFTINSISCPPSIFTFTNTVTLSTSTTSTLSVTCTRTRTRTKTTRIPLPSSTRTSLTTRTTVQMVTETVSLTCSTSKGVITTTTQPPLCTKRMHICERYRRRLAIVYPDPRDGMLKGMEAGCACAKYGWAPARLALEDMPDAAALLSDCIGEDAAAWIGSAPSGGGSGGKGEECVAVRTHNRVAAVGPRPCFDLLPVMCRRDE